MLGIKPSSSSLSLSERKVMDSSFLVNFASKLVILVWAKFNCIFRYSLLAASSVRAGVFLGRLEGGAEAAALGGGGADTLGGQGGGRERVMPGGWRNTGGICMGLGGLDEEEDGGWLGGASVVSDGVDCRGCTGWVRRVRLLKAGSL